MSRVAFIGKGAVTNAEADLLSGIGMAIAIHGDELVTTPAGGAAAAVAQGYRAAAGRVATLRAKPTEGANDVIVYPDARIHEALVTRDPSPLTLRWTLLLTEADLNTFTEITLGILAAGGRDLA